MIICIFDTWIFHALRTQKVLRSFALKNCSSRFSIRKLELTSQYKRFHYMTYVFSLKEAFLKVD